MSAQWKNNPANPTDVGPCEHCDGTGMAVIPASPVQGAASAPSVGTIGHTRIPGMSPIGDLAAASATDVCPACELPSDAFTNCGAPNCAVRDYGPGDARARRALAERAPAVQPVAGQAVTEFLADLLNDRINMWSNYVQMVEASKAGPNPIFGTDEDACRERIIKAQAALAWLVATPAPEQEAAQAAPPGAQEAVGRMHHHTQNGHTYLRPEFTKHVADGALLYAAPVLAATPAEQPEGDSSHVMRPFGAPAGQHGASGEVLTDVRIVELAEAWAMTSHAYQSTPLNHCLDFARAIEAELASGSREGRDGCNESGNLGAANTDKGGEPLTRCAAGRDGECSHAQCPQLRDNEPHASGRHCPLDTQGDDE